LHYDENNMTEDLEIGFRLKSRGYDIYNSMDSVAYTEIPESFSKLFTQRMRWYRGHIQNTAKYSKSLMGRNFWDMGIVVIMFLYILLPLTSAMFLYGVYNFLISAGKGIIDISLIGIDFNYLSNTFVFNAITPTTFFITSLMIFFAAILKISENNIEGKINRLEYPFYVIFYSFLNIFLWGNAFFQEIIGKKSKW
jgi:cellulose synthase/poly-beta-1,6-N-acetylglucosamine synthase-like glycosyltransferase